MSIGDLGGQLERLKEPFLWAAARGGRMEEVEQLLGMGADVNWRKPESDETALLAAARHGNTSTVRRLLRVPGVDIDATVGAGQTALHLACESGQADMAHALISAGADPARKTRAGKTPAELASAAGHMGLALDLSSVAAKARRRSSSSGSSSSSSSAPRRRSSGRSDPSVRELVREATREKSSRDSRDSRDSKPQPAEGKRPERAAPAPAPSKQSDDEDDGSDMASRCRRAEDSARAAETKSMAVREQAAKLWAELSEAQDKVVDLERRAEAAERKAARLSGEELDALSVAELEALEEALGDASRRVAAAKEQRLRAELGAERDQKLCVVCQEADKSILLLPCRHLCLCGPCSRRREVRACPLCRKTISERLEVYS